MGRCTTSLTPTGTLETKLLEGLAPGRDPEYTGKPDKGVRSNIHLSDPSTYAICSFTIAELTLSPWKKVQNCTFAE
jgi:hypothetical protein